MHRLAIRMTCVFALVVISLCAGSGAAGAQSADAVGDLVQRINYERLARGLVPYALNAQLAQAAQAHANDIAHTGRYSHTGSDGSTVFERVARTGYGAYSWGRRLGENWAWYHDAATAIAQWMDSAPHRSNLLHTLYREIGIGIAHAESGGFVYVVVFGAQPNVLPVFVDEGAPETHLPNVTLTLSNEDVMPAGDGTEVIGQAVEMRISDSPDFVAAPWRPFASHIAWTLTPGNGTKTIYVRFRDAHGRMAISSDSVIYNAPVTLTPRPTRTRTPDPTAASTRASSPTDTPIHATTEIRTATSTAESFATGTPTIVEASTAAGTMNASLTLVSDPFALGFFGIAVMLIVLTAVYYVARK